MTRTVSLAPFPAALAALLFAAGACMLPAEPVSYQRQVRPILERSCLACHACYDAPCQLKLGSPEGVDRGASQEAVYAAARLREQATTRLFVDAPDTAGWREKGFASVTEGGAASLMARMLELGREHGVEPNQPLAEHIEVGLNRENQCPRAEEFDAYAEERPEQGMPFGVTPLSEGDYGTLQTWLEQGAPLEAPDRALTPEERVHVRTWESFLNQPGEREQLVARYLFEHLYLGHLYFGEGTDGRFFRLVRSRTPPGQPVVPVAARRPNYDPGGEFYYRLRLEAEAIVHKTHITYDLPPSKLARFRELFLAGDWDVEALPAYNEAAAINPFETFQAIPAEARYRFMLDDALFFVRTFIRGPVCRGQAATDVIDDHFFALFQRPEADLFLLDEAYAASQVHSLTMPGKAEHRRWRLGIRPGWLRDEQTYAKKRRKAYQARGGFGWGDLWDGDGTNPDALLTIFRNHDSSTVTRGLVGEVPKTLWVMDYPIFERIYYQLVVNFDVFGPATHQLATRLYFDLLRAESEANFLRFMPRDERKPMRDFWYRGTFASLKRSMVYEDLDRVTETRIPRRGGDPKEDFVAELLRRAAAIAGPEDHLNRCASKPCRGESSTPVQAAAEPALQQLTNRRGADTPFLLELPEVTFLRVEGGDLGPDEAYTLVRDRAHSSVAFMMGEDKRLLPEEDGMTLVRGPLNSYPNFLLRVPVGEVQELVDDLLALRGPEGWAGVVERYGVRRTRPDFWDHFHFFTEWMRRNDPVEAGVFDLNRYANF